MEPASSNFAASQQDTTIPPPGQVNIVGIRIGYGLGGLGWLTCFLVASRIGPDTGIGAASTIWINILICLFGSTAGWWLGILMSPDPTEQGQFTSLRKAVSAFLSGFVLAKIDILFQDAVAQHLTNSPLFMGRIGLFVTTALICAQFTYVARHNLGMYGVRRLAKGSAQSPTIPTTTIARVELSRAQLWLRIVGLALSLFGIGLFVYRTVLRSVEVEQSITILLLMASALALLFSTSTVREWLFGRGKADERIKAMRVTEDSLTVDLLDGRTVAVPLAWYPRLLHASEAQRNNFRVIGAGYVIHWPDLDEHLSAQGLLAGAPAPGAAVQHTG